MKTIHKLLLVLIVMVLGGNANASILQDSYLKELNDVKGIRLLTVDNVNGDCRVVAVPGDTIHIEGAIRVKGGSDEECREFYERAEIKTVVEGDTVHLDVKYPKNRGFFNMGRSVAMIVDFEIQVPEAMDVDVDLVNGDVTLEKLRDCRIDLVNGDILASTINSIVVDAVNGNIEIQGVAESVNCDVVNGGLKLYTESLALHKVVAEAVNGTMQVYLPAAVLGRIQMSSATGITYLKEEAGDGEWKVKLKSKCVTMAEDGPARINLENVNGKIILFCKQ